MDSYHKLKLYGTEINNCIDGFSCYVVWMVAYRKNNPIVIRTLVLFKELHLLSEHLEPSISSHLSIVCWFSLQKGGHLFHVFGVFPPEQTQFSAQSLQSPNTDNYAVFMR